jgi:hypothetical protein
MRKDALLSGTTFDPAGMEERLAQGLKNAGVSVAVYERGS